MNVNVDYVDAVRKYWITDPMTQWKILDYPLSATERRGCVLNPDGSILDAADQADVPAPDSVAKVVYLGYMLNIWGHCITDNLKKLWFLDTPACRQLLEQGYQLCCTLHGDKKKLSPNFCELCAYLGIDAQRIHVIAVPTKVDVLVEPVSTLDKSHHLHLGFKQVANRIRDHIQYNEALPRKIYFSRARLHNGRDFGEKYVEEVFRRLGYHVVYPEQCSLKEQLEMIYSCDSFAATEGSVSHNNMFCRPEAEAVIIRKTRSCNGYQYSANFVSGCRLCYVDAHLSIFNIFDNAFGPFFLYVNDNLVAFARSRGLSLKKHFPLRTFLNYLAHVLWYALRYRTKIVPIGDFDFYRKRLAQDLKEI